MDGNAGGAGGVARPPWPTWRLHAERRGMTTNDVPGDYVAQNREAWDRMAADYVEGGRRNWDTDEVTWGIFDTPEAMIGMLPPDLAGLDTIELGCGTGYVSAWLARRGARPVGHRQLRRRNWRRRVASSRSSASISRCIWGTPSRRPSPTPASTSPSASTAPRSGAIPTAGSRRPRASCARAGGSSFLGNSWL